MRFKNSMKEYFNCWLSNCGNLILSVEAYLQTRTHNVFWSLGKQKLAWILSLSIPISSSTASIKKKILHIIIAFLKSNESNLD